ncbi:MAG: hypothetical protein M1561_00355 [Gammaproteobacteria bacterium]|nr:hypothetical protein [Gammaproteobacteria bacterium]
MWTYIAQLYAIEQGTEFAADVVAYVLYQSNLISEQSYERYKILKKDFHNLPVIKQLNDYSYVAELIGAVGLFSEAYKKAPQIMSWFEEVIKDPGQAFTRISSSIN